jgi:hypothetical protein
MYVAAFDGSPSTAFNAATSGYHYTLLITSFCSGFPHRATSTKRLPVSFSPSHHGRANLRASYPRAGDRVKKNVGKSGRCTGGRNTLSPQPLSPASRGGGERSFTGRKVRESDAQSKDERDDLIWTTYLDNAVASVTNLQGD